MATSNCASSVATGQCDPLTTMGTPKGNRQETSDDYDAVVCRLSPKHRVIRCRDGIQWILQRRRGGVGDWPWKALHYCTTRKAVLRVSASAEQAPDPVAWAILEALPDRISQAGENEPKYQNLEADK